MGRLYIQLFQVFLFYFLSSCTSIQIQVNSASTKTTTTSTNRASLSTDSSKQVQQSYNVSVVTWNLAEAAPTSSHHRFLEQFKDSDIVVIGVQECENIKPRRNEGHRSKAWREIQPS